MKKLFTSSFLIVLIVISSFTNAKSQGLAVGLEAGVNFANVNKTPVVVSGSSRTGLIIGGVVDIGLSPNLGITTGLRYVMKGFSETGAFNGVNGVFTTKGNYLEFPVLLKVKFPLTEVKPYLIGGPTLGLKLTSDIEFLGNNGSTVSGDNSANVESIDFGLLFGGGLDFRVAPKIDLFIQGAYSLGLSNVEKTTVVVGTPSSTKTYGFYATAGVKFRL